MPAYRSFSPDDAAGPETIRMTVDEYEAVRLLDHERLTQEACADRNAISSALRDVITATQAQTQTILDKMCQQEIEALKAQNANLQTQVNLQNLAASQAAQTAALVADNNLQTQYIVNRVAPYPVPAYTVANPATPAA